MLIICQMTGKPVSVKPELVKVILLGYNSQDHPVRMAFGHTAEEPLGGVHQKSNFPKLCVKQYLLDEEEDSPVEQLFAYLGRGWSPCRFFCLCK